MFSENKCVFRLTLKPRKFGAKNMGDNIGISSYWTLPYNAICAVSLTSLYHDMDPDHSIVSRFQCMSYDMKD